MPHSRAVQIWISSSQDSGLTWVTERYWPGSCGAAGRSTRCHPSSSSVSQLHGLGRAAAVKQVRPDRKPCAQCQLPISCSIVPARRQLGACSKWQRRVPARPPRHSWPSPARLTPRHSPGRDLCTAGQPSLGLLPGLPPPGCAPPLLLPPPRGWPPLRPLIGEPPWPPAPPGCCGLPRSPVAAAAPRCPPGGREGRGQGRAGVVHGPALTTG